MTESSTAKSASPGVILLRPDRFFTRRVPLVAGTAAAAQVELALENFSPFPIDQLYHGHVASPAGDQALVYAAHRKQFSAEEIAGWSDARIVLPAFVALLGAPPASAVIRLWHGREMVTVAGWDGRSPIPAIVLTRAAGDKAALAELVAEVRDRTGLGKAPVEEFSGEATGMSDPDGKGFNLAIATPGGARSVALAPENVASADVREKEFLAERQRTGRRDQLLWRGFSGGLVGLAVLLVLELVLAGGGLALRRLRAGIQQRAPAVEKISTAQGLSQRIEELSRRQLMPFEMVAAVNRYRPASVVFLRVTTTGQHALEMESQTSNASDAGAYEAALRAQGEFSAVETRDLRSRDGTTTFTVVVTFRETNSPATPGSTP